MIEYLFFICYNFNVGSNMKKNKNGFNFFYYDIRFTFIN